MKSKVRIPSVNGFCMKGSMVLQRMLLSIHIFLDFDGERP